MAANNPDFYSQKYQLADEVEVDTHSKVPILKTTPVYDKNNMDVSLVDLLIGNKHIVGTDQGRAKAYSQTARFNKFKQVMSDSAARARATAQTNTVIASLLQVDNNRATSAPYTAAPTAPPSGGYGGGDKPEV